MDGSAPGGQKRSSIPENWSHRLLVRGLMWVRSTECGSSGGAKSALNQQSNATNTYHKTFCHAMIFASFWV